MRVRTLKIVLAVSVALNVFALAGAGAYVVSRAQVERKVDAQRGSGRQDALAEVLAGLQAKYRGQPATVRTPALEARVLARTRQKPPDGSTHWTTRKLATVLGISHMLVARIWRRAGYQPHRFERYMLSDDPDFEQKAADVIGLYLNPPKHAVVVAVDEKTAIQALDRLDPVLPLSPALTVSAQATAWGSIWSA